MARRGGISPEYVQQNFIVACGSVDQNNPVDATVPCDGIQLVQATFTTKTAGTGTGTFSVKVTYGGTPTDLSPASSATFIDADAVAGTYHGTLNGFPQVQGSEGARLGISTVKTGTVSADATLIVGLIWRM